MAKNKKGIGFFGGLFIYLLGISTGTIGAGVLAAYINKLHLPFIEASPTREDVSLPKSNDDSDEQSEELLFRNLLQQDNQVVVPATTTPATEPQQHQFSFYLQIGSFRSENTAETLRGNVVLSGYDAIINSGTLNDGSTLYRVWIGPYTNQNEAEKVRAQLTLEGYQDVSLLQFKN